MKKLSFLVNHLGPNQISYLLCKNIPEFIKNNPDTDVCVFYETLFQHAFYNQFCIMSSNELWGYDGPCISMSFDMAEKLLKMPTVRKKIHFSFDFDWCFQVYNTERLNRLYSNPSLEFFVRTEEHARQFKDRWNRDCKVVGDLNVSEISKII